MPRPLKETTKIAMAAIERAVAAGAPCPTNHDLCALADKASPSFGPKVLKALVSAGLIRVQRGPISRVVTILATGKSTAGEITRPHWRDCAAMPPAKKSGPAARAAVQAQVMPRIERDPCPRCGVRRDHGCSHYPAMALEGSAA